MQSHPFVVTNVATDFLGASRTLRASASPPGTWEGERTTEVATPIERGLKTACGRLATTAVRAYMFTANPSTTRRRASQTPVPCRHGPMPRLLRGLIGIDHRTNFGGPCKPFAVLVTVNG